MNFFGFKNSSKKRIVHEHKNQIPGMIEPIEQELLFDLAKSISLKPDEVMVEFGTFFGRSTRCILDGYLEANPSTIREQYSALYVYDSFSCRSDGPFFPHVIQHAKSDNVEHLLIETENTVSFEGIFNHYMQDINSDTLSINRSELESMHHSGAKIKLIHFDLPKWYDDYKILLDRFSPQLQEGAYILYQDFFYHWSASLIAAVQYWINLGIITPIKTAASTLLVKLNRQITKADLDELNKVMAEQDLSNIISTSIDYFEKFEVDRKSIFASRLRLAQLQHCFENQDYDTAAEAMAFLLDHSLCKEPVLANDLKELTRFGFSMRKLYQDDH